MSRDNRSGVPVISRYKEAMSLEELERLALQLRRDVIEITRFSGTGSSHVGGELSLAEMMAVLYGRVLKLDPRDPGWRDRDRMILSKGHASAVTYAAMAWRGFFARERLWNEFNRVEGRLEEHANMELEGIEAPTGSLGMGLSNGCGMAWCAKRESGAGPPSHRVFVVLSDGECTEGQTWEAAMLAGHLRLDNLIALVDANKYIISGTVEEVLSLEPLSAKWAAFNWQVRTVDGHDVGALAAALEEARDPATAPGKPRVLIADTVKGYPISFMMGDAVNWHAGHLTSEQYRQAMKELGYG